MSDDLGGYVPRESCSASVLLGRGQHIGGLCQPLACSQGVADAGVAGLADRLQVCGCGQVVDAELCR